MPVGRDGRGHRSHLDLVCTIRHHPFALFKAGKDLHPLPVVNARFDFPFFKRFTFCLDIDVVLSVVLHESRLGQHQCMLDRAGQQVEVNKRPSQQVSPIIHLEKDRDKLAALPCHFAIRDQPAVEVLDAVYLFLPRCFKIGRPDILQLGKLALRHFPL